MITQEVVERLILDTKKVFDFYDLMKIRKSAKNKSEDISSLLETAMEDLIEGAVAPKVDSEPDIRFNGDPIEIKTSSGETWRGGAYSKRGGHFVFVTWELSNNNTPSFFIAGIDLIESDWKLSKSKNYYATTFGKKELYDNRERVTFYHGSMEGYMRGKIPCIRIYRSYKQYDELGE